MVKSPLNYTGGKYKLLPQITPLFPKKISGFFDVFAGGCNVGVNAPDSDKVVCNDISAPVVSFMNLIKETTADNFIHSVEEVIGRYSLSDSFRHGYAYYGCDSNKGLGTYNKPGYERLRADYNKSAINSPLSDVMFYVLTVFSFNNQIRYNSKGGFNMPVGKRDFNENMKNNLTAFIKKLKTLDIDFLSGDFADLYDRLNPGDFAYCDPPYLLTCAAYNENGGWNETAELKLLDFLDELSKKNIKFALSNVISHKGTINKVLSSWCKKYKVNALDYGYYNCNYHAKDKSRGSSMEVLITNY